MRSELHEEDPSVNIVFRSGIMTRDDKGEQPEESTCVRKAPTKELEFDLECAKKTFIEAKESIINASTSGRKDRPPLDAHNVPRNMHEAAM